MRVTIRDVARLAGVSAMTVSRVMNRNTAVGADARRAVLAAVDTLNYAPNPAARSLARGGTGQIGLLYSNPSANYLSEFLLGALDGSQKVGSQLTVEKCDDDAQSERAAVRRLASSGVVGLVIPPPHGESAAVLKEAKRLNLETVVVASGVRADAIRSVRIDDQSASEEMTQYLLDLGHRRIGFICGASNQSASAERLAGARKAVEAAGAELLVEAGDFTYRSGLDAAERLLAADNPPTAIFASNDDMAMGAIAVAGSRGLQVPGDLSIAGFDDTPAATLVWPGLTTVRQPVADMASAAIRLLAGPVDDRAEIILPHTLQIRGTTAAPRG